MNPSNKHIEELNGLYKRASIILNFLIEKTTNKNLMTPFADVLEAAYKRSDLRGLRILNRDLSSWSKALSKTDMVELKNILGKEPDETDSIAVEDKRSIEIIRNVINKKRIANEEEYSIVDDYLKDISESDLFFSNQAMLQDLLLKFEKEIRIK